MHQLFFHYKSCRMNSSNLQFQFQLTTVKMLFCLVLLTLSFNLATADNDNSKVSFISSFIESQHKPTTLIVWRDCFDAKHKFKLVKDSFTFTTFSKQESLNEREFRINPQHCLFVVDLTCTNIPERIIEKVNSLSLPFSLLDFESIFLLCTDWRFTFLASISMDDVCQRQWSVQQYSCTAW